MIKTTPILKWYSVLLVDPVRSAQLNAKHAWVIYALCRAAANADSGRSRRRLVDYNTA